MVTLSVVMPAYNEAAHIERAVSEWYERVVVAIPGAELVVVDDCSTDGTGALLGALAERLAGLRVLRTPRNMGHGPALRLGLEQCRGEYVFQTDSDRQHTPEDFWKLWREREAADFVFGRRLHRADGAFRSIVSGVMRVANLVLWQRWIRDANCPFKLMRRDALALVLAAIPRGAFIPMVMLSLLARRGPFQVSNVDVRHYARAAGTQSLAGLLTWARVGQRCLRELVLLRLAMAGMTGALPAPIHPALPRPVAD